RIATALVNLELPLLDLHDRWPRMDVPARVEAVRRDVLDDPLAHRVRVLNNRSRDSADGNPDAESGTPEGEDPEDEPPFIAQLAHVCLLPAVGRAKAGAAQDGERPTNELLLQAAACAALPAAVAADPEDAAPARARGEP